jgi:hypothetical protein
MGRSTADAFGGIRRHLFALTIAVMLIGAIVVVIVAFIVRLP